MKLFLKLIIILVFGGYNLYLYTTNQINNYINPNFFEYSHIASLTALSVSLLGLLYLLFKNYKTIKPWILKYRGFIGKFIILFVVGFLAFVVNVNLLLLDLLLTIVFFKKVHIPVYISYLGLTICLLLFIFTAPKSLSSITAYQRESDFNTVSLQGSSSVVQTFSNTDNYDLGDWITSLNYNPDLSFYKGKNVNVKGFIFKKDSLGSNIFLVSRFVITCCAVDARPVGMPVISGNWDKEFKVDDWVLVHGKFDIQNIEGKDQLVIIADNLEKIDEPNNPYIY